MEIERFAEYLGVNPNQVTASYREKPRGMTSHKGYDLRRYRRRVQEQIEAGNVTYVALTCLAEDWGYKCTDWDFHSEFGQFGDGFSMLLSGISFEALRSISEVSPAQFTRDVVKRGRAVTGVAYGMAVVMPKLFMPHGYAMGLASGELPQEMVYDANSWRQYAAKQGDHVIRNVFGYNILNAAHLEIDVAGHCLGDWIRASNDRGRIEPLEGGLFLWTFQEGDDQDSFLRWDYPPVVRTREELKLHKIFPWQRLPGVE